MVSDSVVSEGEVAPARSTPRAPVIVAGVLLLAGGALGALGGWLWYQWWEPANSGSIYNTEAGPRWYDLSDQGVEHQFDGPAQYAVVALGLGLVLGVVGTLLARRQALAALAGLILGSALAAYLSWAVGTMLSPPDPQQYATEANVCTEEPCKEYDAAIEVSGWTPFLVWPIGALGAFCVATLASSGAGELRRTTADQQQAGNWLAPGGRQAVATDDRSAPPPPP